MTMQSTPSPAIPGAGTPGSATDRALAAAAEAAAVLPAAEQLVATGAQPGDPGIAGMFAAGVVADVDAGSRIAVLVGPDLVTALAESPMGGLDLAAAVQPALDAIAGSLGGSAGAGRQVELGLLVADLAGPFTTVPLVGQGIVAAVLIADPLLTVATPEPAGFAASTPAAPVAQPAAAGAPAAAVGSVDAPHRGIEMLHGVDMEVTVEVGRTRMTVRDLLALSPGAVLELEQAAGSPADLLVNGRLIARGEIVVVDEDFGLRVTEIVAEKAAG